MNIVNPTIEDASHDFYEQHIGSYWFQAVGIGLHEGKPAIVVYTKKRQVPPRIRELTELQGFPLIWQHSGEIKIGG